jgi:hypothetical protein
MEEPGHTNVLGQCRSTSVALKILWITWDWQKDSSYTSMYWLAFSGRNLANVSTRRVLPQQPVTHILAPLAFDMLLLFLHRVMPPPVLNIST